MAKRASSTQRRAKPAQSDDEFAPLSDDEALRRRVIRQVNKRREFQTHLIIFLAFNALFLVVFTAIDIPWVAAVILFGWGSGLAAHGVDTWYQTGRRATNRLARMHQAFRDAYGPDWHETASVQQLRAIRKRLDDPINKRKEFYMHAAVYLCTIVSLWLVYFMATPDGFLWPLVVMAGWGLGLLGHAFEAFSHGRSESTIEQEMERQRAQLEAAQYGSEKPKNDFREADDQPALTVGPDGELVEPDAETDERATTRRAR